MKNSKHIRSCLVELTTRIKKNVSEVVIKCPLVMDGLITYADLNVLPLGSYDFLTGMNWLEAHKENIEKEGHLKVMKSIPKSDLQ